MLLKQVISLILKDFMLEWRQRYTLSGIFLYAGTTVFICYMSVNVKINRLDPITWNILFWIIFLFVAVNAAAKSFVQENKGRFLYYFQTMRPEAVLIAKITYNSFLLFIISLLSLMIYSVVMGNPVQSPYIFVLNLLLGALGFSSALTLISAIASKTENSSTLMAILGFPVLIPILMLLIKISMNAIDGLPIDIFQDEILTLSAIIILISTVSYLLFPYLWRS